ncbi:hypothetical protein TL16_g00401 [Triparma laevis f. inornata]|uniref:EF-hand domain-containing protein n=1 Tax=Triparma laevis f. inornata TaxID=1714386 RepID=A0A9W6ZEH2_9STRA|nr:hypothetical protein TL16_g00401 [Triparma laevis f. inornata]
MFRNRGSTLFHEDEELESSNRKLAQKAILFTLVYIFFGVLCFSLAEGWTFIHAFYFVVVTLTTVGYGDQGDWVSEFARFFCSVYALVGILLLGTALGVIGSEIITQHEKVVKEMQRKAAIKREKKKKKKKGLPRGSESNLSDSTETTRFSSFSSSNPYNQSVYRTLFVPFLTLFFIIACGMLLIHFDNGKLSLNECLYFAIITVTTIGYGDIYCKGFAIIYILFGVTAVGNVLTEIANKVIDHQHAAAMESILTRKIKAHEFKDFDLDGNGTIERTEYVLRKMILVGLVDQSDILRVEKEFDLMDLDGSGEITMDELIEFEKRESPKDRESDAPVSHETPEVSVNPLQDENKVL